MVAFWHESFAGLSSISLEHNSVFDLPPLFFSKELIENSTSWLLLVHGFGMYPLDGVSCDRPFHVVVHDAIMILFASDHVVNCDENKKTIGFLSSERQQLKLPTLRTFKPLWVLLLQKIVMSS